MHIDCEPGDRCLRDGQGAALIHCLPRDEVKAELIACEFVLIRIKIIDVLGGKGDQLVTNLISLGNSFDHLLSQKSFFNIKLIATYI